MPGAAAVVPCDEVRVARAVIVARVRRQTGRRDHQVGAGHRDVDALEARRIRLGHAGTDRRRAGRERELPAAIAIGCRGVVAARQDRRAVVAADDARVVAGRHLVRAEPRRDGEQLLELHPAVAGGARARRLAGEVRVDEGGDDLLCEEGTPVERVVREAERVGGAARVVLVFGGAAAGVAPFAAFAARVVRVVPKVQRNAHDLVARFVETGGGDR